MSKEYVIDELFDLMTQRGADEAYCGKPVTQTQHMLQAASLAEREGADGALIAAALLHDIGHLLNGDDTDTGDHPHDRAHEYAAATRLRAHFSDAVVQPAALHVDAKRYLCFKASWSRNTL